MIDQLYNKNVGQQIVAPNSLALRVLKAPQLCNSIGMHSSLKRLNRVLHIDKEFVSILLTYCFVDCDGILRIFACSAESESLCDKYVPSGFFYLCGSHCALLQVHETVSSIGIIPMNKLGRYNLASGAF